jgi:hypothetical protein
MIVRSKGEESEENYEAMDLHVIIHILIVVQVYSLQNPLTVALISAIFLNNIKFKIQRTDHLCEISVGHDLN